MWRWRYGGRRHPQRRSGYPAIDTIQLVYSHFSDWQPAWREASVALLSTGEKQRLARFGNAARSDQFLAGRLLVRTLIAENRNCEPREILLSASAPDCARDAQGRLLGFLSISHCGNTLVVAVSRQLPLGVDCEHLKPKRNWLGIARAYFSARETDWLAAVPPEAAAQLFLHSWTCKEALAKCSARELGQVLKQAEILRDKLSLPDSLKQFRCWSGALTPELVLALAAKPAGNSPGEIACFFRPAIERADYQPAAFLQQLIENAD